MSSAAMFAAVLLTANQSLAADKYWDTNGTTAGAGGATPSGTWDTGTTANWNAATGGTGSATTWSSSDNAFFSAGTDATGAFTITPSGTITIGMLTVQEGTPTLPSGTLNFVTLSIAPDNGQISTLVNNGATITSTGAGTYVIGAAASLTGTGNGTYTQTAGSLSAVSGASAFNIANGSASTGHVDISGGTLTTNLLRVGARGNGTLDVSGTASVTAVSITVGSDIAGTLTGSGAMTVSGGSVLINGASGTFTVGNLRPGTYMQTGGTVSYASGSGFALNVGNQAGGVGSMSVSGGSLSSTGIIRLAPRANGTLTVSGTGVVESTAATGLEFGLSGGTPSTAILNLDGGTLKVKNVTYTAGTASFRFNGGTLQAAVDNATFFTGFTNLRVRNGGAVVDTNGFDVTIAPNLIHSDIGGDDAIDGGLTKKGAGILTLSGTNTYTGNTNVNTGTLALSHASNNSIASSPTITLASGTTFDTTGLGGTADLVLASGQTLEGTGTVVGNLSVGGGATIAPGASPGTMFQVGDQTWTDGGTFNFEIDNANATAGGDPGWSLMDITGSLDLTGLSPDGFTIDIDSLLHPSHVPGSLDVDWGTTYVWDFVRTTGIVDFEPDLFVLDTSGFTSTTNGDFTIRQTGNNLELVFQTVPEPVSFELWLTVAVIAVGFGYRKLSWRSK